MLYSGQGYRRSTTDTRKKKAGIDGNVITFPHIGTI